MKRFVLLLVIAAIVGVVPVFAADVHAIFVIDTDDPNIGDSVRKDMENVEAMLRDAAGRTNMGISVQRFIDRNMTTDRVAAAVRGLDPGPDDMVVFYYSGHGFRTRLGETRYPALSMEGSPDLELYWVFEELYNKDPRLLIVMADACNNILPDSMQPSAPEEKSRVEANVTDNYRALFREASGAVIASSSIPGQYSQALSSGGAYTLEWLAAIQEGLTQPGPNWPDIMSASVEPILFYGGDRQDPQFNFVERGIALRDDMFNDMGFLVAEPEGERETTSGRLGDGDVVDGSGFYQDRYLFDGRSGVAITVGVNSGTFDTFVSILDSSGELVASNDDFENTNSRVTFSPSRSGTYTIVVTSYSPGEQGAYELYTYNLEGLRLPDIAATSSGGGSQPLVAPPVVDGEYAVVRGELTEGDGSDDDGFIVDVYRFEARRRDRVSLRLTSPDFDTYLTVRTPSGDILENDDFGGSDASLGPLDSGLDFQTTAAGEHFVYVRSYWGDAAGRYSVSFDGPGDLTPVFEAATGGSDTVTARLSSRDQQLSLGEYYHVYSFNGRRGDRIRIRMESPDVDSYLVLEGPEGDWGNQNDDADDTSLDSELALTLSQTGTYLIYATTYGGEETGSYTLTTENIADLERVQ